MFDVALPSTQHPRLPGGGILPAAQRPPYPAGGLALPRGYKAQSEMVLESLDSLIRACEGRRESLVVEGVHLSLNAVVRLMGRHPSIVPFLIHISNEAKHRERFAVRTAPATLHAVLIAWLPETPNVQQIIIAAACGNLPLLHASPDSCPTLRVPVITGWKGGTLALYSVCG